MLWIGNDVVIFIAVVKMRRCLNSLPDNKHELNLSTLFYLALSQILYTIVIYPILVLASKIDLDSAKETLETAVNIIYYSGEVVMTLSLMCFFKVIRSIAKEAIIANA